MSGRAFVRSITIGERDRADLGNIEELAASIDEVGLLHPIVITEDLRLVAGGRRLEACRLLGWDEVPVTVVDLATAADVLKAEMDENVCRKSLTLIEASRARERRAKALAPIAAERERAGVKQPSSNLDEGPSTARATRKVAAIGTGYSGSTLDKVDRVREIAERGTLTTRGATKPVPEPVREIAKAAVVEMQEGRENPTRSISRVDEALTSYLAQDPEIARHAFVRDLLKLQISIGHLVKLDPERVARSLDVDGLELLAHDCEAVAAWHSRVIAAQPGRLKLVGGKQ